jgi:hypothetical protein
MPEFTRPCETSGPSRALSSRDFRRRADFKNLRQRGHKNPCFHGHRPWLQQHISSHDWNRTRSENPVRRAAHLVEFASVHPRLYKTTPLLHCRDPKIVQRALSSHRNDCDSENQSLDHNPYWYHRIVSLSIDGISGDDPSLEYRPTFALLIAAFAAFEAKK